MYCSQRYKNLVKITFVFINLGLAIKRNDFNLRNNKNSLNNYFYNISENYNNTNKTYLFEKINKFIEICKEGKLINIIKHRYKSPTKITSIIPVYNASKTIKTAIRSIQNQNMNEIEILLVDDASTDNSIDIINELMIEDKRIKLIKNKKNRGTLYSRSIGVLNSKGKYIMPLDNDDLFLYDIFNKCYEEAEKNEHDIVEFSGLQICKNCSADMNNIYIPWFLRFKNNGLVVKQPKLSTFEYIKTSSSFDFIDVFAWGKLIKKETYIKAIDSLGTEIYEHRICLTEDKILILGLFKVANSFKFIDVYGMIYFENPDSICHTWSISKRKRVIHDFFMLSVIYFNLTKNTDEIQIVVDEMKKHFDEFSTLLDENHKILFMKLYKDILKCNNVLESEKKILINLMNNNKDSYNFLT